MGPITFLLITLATVLLSCLGLPVVLAGAPLTAPESPLILKIMVLIVLPLLAARLQVRTYGKNQENQPHFSVHS